MSARARACPVGPPLEVVRVSVHALPVYAPGHRDRVAAALRALPSRVALAGAAYGGLGVPDCIRTGEEGARRLVAALASLIRGRP